MTLTRKKPTEQHQKQTSASARNSLTSTKVDATFVNPNETGNYITIPPDGGWGWVIVVAAFLSFTFTDGITYCFGLFMENIAKEYMVSITLVSITTSLITSETYLFGPVFCALINRYTFRLVGLMGAIGACVCVLCASFAPNIFVFILFMGVLLGVFLSMVYITGCIIVGFYFDRWRALATAISVSGSATGVVFVPILVGLMEGLTWRVQFQIMSGILVIIIFAAMTYRSIKPVLVERTSTSNIATRLQLLEQLNYNEDELSEEYDSSSMTCNLPMRMNRIHNLRYPTAADVHTGGTVVISQMGPVEFQMAKSANTSMVSEFNRIDYDAEAKRKCPINCNLCFKKLHREETQMYIATRPLYREDIFFHAPLTRLDIYRSSKEGPIDPATYHMEVTRVAAYQDILDQQSERCVWCPHAVVRIWSTMFDMNLLRHSSFAIFMLSGFFTAAGMYVPFIYVKDMNMAAGLGEQQSRNLLCAIGFTNIVGRMLCGVVSIYPKIKAIIVMEVALTISGISVILLPFFPNIYVQYACGSVFGITIAVNGALRPIVLVDLYGLGSLTNAFGIALLFQGVACSFGIPVAGILKDVTGSYHALMIFTGGCLSLSGLLILLVEPLIRREQNAEYAKRFAERMGSTDIPRKEMPAGPSVKKV